LLFPANGPSASQILPQHQDLSVGDWILDGPPEADCHFEVELLEPNKMMVLRSTSHLPPQVRDNDRVRMLWTWSFHLEETSAGKTRLLFRMRGDLEPWWLSLLYQLLIVPADFIMGRSFCLGLKKRVERSRQTR